MIFPDITLNSLGEKKFLKNVHADFVIRHFYFLSPRFWFPFNCYFANFKGSLTSGSFLLHKYPPGNLQDVFPVPRDLKGFVSGCIMFSEVSV